MANKTKTFPPSNASLTMNATLPTSPIRSDKLHAETVVAIVIFCIEFLILLAIVFKALYATYANRRLTLQRNTNHEFLSCFAK